MGYLTNFQLQVVGVPGLPVKDEQDKEIRGNLKFAEFVHFLDAEGAKEKRAAVENDMEVPVSWIKDFWTGEADACKWYGHERDMIVFSKNFPDLVFKLEGKGEEPDDIWVKYFKDGKMQVCHAKITYDPYVESNLK